MGYEVDIWHGLVAPAKTRNDAVSQLATWFSGTMRLPELRAKDVALGLCPKRSCDVDFGAHIRKQYEEYGRVIREASIKSN